MVGESAAPLRSPRGDPEMEKKRSKHSRDATLAGPRGWPFAAGGPLGQFILPSTREDPMQVDDGALAWALWESSRRHSNSPVPLRRLKDDPAWAQLCSRGPQQRPDAIDDTWVDMKLAKRLLGARFSQAQQRSSTHELEDTQLLGQLAEEALCGDPDRVRPPVTSVEPDEDVDPGGHWTPGKAPARGRPDPLSEALMAADRALQRVARVPPRRRPTSGADQRGVVTGAPAQWLDHYGNFSNGSRAPSTKASPIVSVMGQEDHEASLWDVWGQRADLNVHVAKLAASVVEARKRQQRQPEEIEVLPPLAPDDRPGPLHRAPEWLPHRSSEASSDGSADVERPTPEAIPCRSVDFRSPPDGLFAPSANPTVPWGHPASPLAPPSGPTGGLPDRLGSALCATAPQPTPEAVCCPSAGVQSPPVSPFSASVSPTGPRSPPASPLAPSSGPTGGLPDRIGSTRPAAAPQPTPNSSSPRGRSSLQANRGRPKGSGPISAPGMDELTPRPADALLSPLDSLDEPSGSPPAAPAAAPSIQPQPQPPAALSRGGPAPSPLSCEPPASPTGRSSPSNWLNSPPSYQSPGENSQSISSHLPPVAHPVDLSHDSRLSDTPLSPQAGGRAGLWSPPGAPYPPGGHSDGSAGPPGSRLAVVGSPSGACGDEEVPVDSIRFGIREQQGSQCDAHPANASYPGTYDTLDPAEEICRCLPPHLRDAVLGPAAAGGDPASPYGPTTLGPTQGHPRSSQPPQGESAARPLESDSEQLAELLHLPRHLRETILGPQLPPSGADNVPTDHQGKPAPISGVTPQHGQSAKRASPEPSGRVGLPEDGEAGDGGRLPSPASTSQAKRPTKRETFTFPALVPTPVADDVVQGRPARSAADMGGPWCPPGAPVELAGPVGGRDGDGGTLRPTASGEDGGIWSPVAPTTGPSTDPIASPAGSKGGQTPAGATTSIPSGGQVLSEPTKKPPTAQQVGYSYLPQAAVSPADQPAALGSPLHKSWSHQEAYNGPDKEFETKPALPHHLPTASGAQLPAETPVRADDSALRDLDDEIGRLDDVLRGLSQEVDPLNPRDGDVFAVPVASSPAAVPFNPTRSVSAHASPSPPVGSVPTSPSRIPTRPSGSKPTKMEARAEPTADGSPGSTIPRCACVRPPEGTSLPSGPSRSNSLRDTVWYDPGLLDRIELGSPRASGDYQPPQDGLGASVAVLESLRALGAADPLQGLATVTLGQQPFGHDHSSSGLMLDTSLQQGAPVSVVFRGLPSDIPLNEWLSDAEDNDEVFASLAYPTSALQLPAGYQTPINVPEGYASLVAASSLQPLDGAESVELPEWMRPRHTICSVDSMPGAPSSRDDSNAEDEAAATTGPLPSPVPQSDHQPGETPRYSSGWVAAPAAEEKTVRAHLLSVEPMVAMPMPEPDVQGLPVINVLGTRQLLLLSDDARPVRAPVAQTCESFPQQQSPSVGLLPPDICGSLRHAGPDDADDGGYGAPHTTEQPWHSSRTLLPRSTVPMADAGSVTSQQDEPSISQLAADLNPMFEQEGRDRSGLRGSSDGSDSDYSLPDHLADMSHLSGQSLPPAGAADRSGWNLPLDIQAGGPSGHPAHREAPASSSTTDDEYDLPGKETAGPQRGYPSAVVRSFDDIPRPMSLVRQSDDEEEEERPPYQYFMAGTTAATGDHISSSGSNTADRPVDPSSQLLPSATHGGSAGREKGPGLSRFGKDSTLSRRRREPEDKEGSEVGGATERPSDRENTTGQLRTLHPDNDSDSDEPSPGFPKSEARLDQQVPRHGSSPQAAVPTSRPVIPGGEAGVCPRHVGDASPSQHRHDWQPPLPAHHQREAPSIHKPVEVSGRVQWLGGGEIRPRDGESDSSEDDFTPLARHQQAGPLSSPRAMSTGLYQPVVVSRSQSSDAFVSPADVAPFYLVGGNTPVWGRRLDMDRQPGHVADPSSLSGQADSESKSDSDCDGDGDGDRPLTRFVDPGSLATGSTSFYSLRDPSPDHQAGPAEWSSSDEEEQGMAGVELAEAGDVGQPLGRRQTDGDPAGPSQDWLEQQKRKDIMLVGADDGDSDKSDGDAVSGPAGGGGSEGRDLPSAVDPRAARLLRDSDSDDSDGSEERTFAPAPAKEYGSHSLDPSDSSGAEYADPALLRRRGAAVDNAAYQVDKTARLVNSQPGRVRNGDIDSEGQLPTGLHPPSSSVSRSDVTPGGAIADPMAVRGSSTAYRSSPAPADTATYSYDDAGSSQSSGSEEGEEEVDIAVHHVAVPRVHPREARGRRSESPDKSNSGNVFVDRSTLGDNDFVDGVGRPTVGSSSPTVDPRPLFPNFDEGESSPSRLAVSRNNGGRHPSVQDHRSYDGGADGDPTAAASRQSMGHSTPDSPTDVPWLVRQQPQQQPRPLSHQPSLARSGSVSGAQQRPWRLGPPEDVALPMARPGRPEGGEQQAVPPSPAPRPPLRAVGAPSRPDAEVRASQQPWRLKQLSTRQALQADPEPVFPQSGQSSPSLSVESGAPRQPPSSSPGDGKGDHRQRPTLRYRAESSDSDGDGDRAMEDGLQFSGGPVRGARSRDLVGLHSSVQSNLTGELSNDTGSSSRSRSSSTDPVDPSAISPCSSLPAAGRLDGPLRPVDEPAEFSFAVTSRGFGVSSDDGSESVLPGAERDGRPDASHQHPITSPRAVPRPGAPRQTAGSLATGTFAGQSSESDPEADLSYEGIDSDDERSPAKELDVSSRSVGGPGRHSAVSTPGPNTGRECSASAEDESDSDIDGSAAAVLTINRSVPARVPSRRPRPRTTGTVATAPPTSRGLDSMATPPPPRRQQSAAERQRPSHDTDSDSESDEIHSLEAPVSSNVSSRVIWNPSSARFQFQPRSTGDTATSSSRASPGSGSGAPPTSRRRRGSSRAAVSLDDDHSDSSTSVESSGMRGVDNDHQHSAMGNRHNPDLDLVWPAAAATGEGPGLLKLAFKGWQDRQTVEREGRERERAARQLGQQRLALSTLHRAASRGAASSPDGQGAVPSQLMPRAVARAILGASEGQHREDLLSFLSAQPEETTEEEETSEGEEGGEQSLLWPAEPHTARGHSPRRGKRRRSPPNWQVEPHPGLLAVLESLRAKAVRRAKHHAFMMWALQARVLRPGSQPQPQQEEGEGADVGCLLPMAFKAWHLLAVARCAREAQLRVLRRRVGHRALWLALRRWTSAVMSSRLERQSDTSTVVIASRAPGADHRGSQARLREAVDLLGSREYAKARARDNDEERAREAQREHLSRHREQKAAEMAARGAERRGLQALLAWRSVVVGEQAARGWEGLAREAQREPSSPQVDPNWDDSGLAQLAQIVGGLSNAQLRSLLEGLSTEDRATVEKQLGILSSQPAASHQPAAGGSGGSFCRSHQAYRNA